jgi:hypothetical protein
MATSTTPEKCERTDLAVHVPFQCHYNLFAKRDADAPLEFRAQLQGGDGFVNSLYWTMTGADAIALPPGDHDFGSWHMYTFTWDPAVKHLYVDGIMIAEGAGATSPVGDLYVGNNSVSTRELLDGAIDDVRIYDRLLTSAQVAALYQQER